MVAIGRRPPGETPLGLVIDPMSAPAGAPGAKGSSSPAGARVPALKAGDQGNEAASEPGSPGSPAAAAFAAVAAQVAEQRERLGQMQAKVRSLRLAAVAATEQQDRTASAKCAAHQARVKELQAESTELSRQEEVLRGETRRGDAAIAKLREVASARESVVADLRGRLEQAQQRMQGLRSDEGKRLFASTSGQQTTILRRALANWDAPGGTRRVCSECFVKADTNHDAKLEWNNGEIKQFVRTVFERCGANVPKWGDMAWYKIYRHSDADGSLSLELEESHRFAKFCFEVALRAVDPLGVVPEALEVTSPRSAVVSPRGLGGTPRAGSPIKARANIQATLSTWKDRQEELTKARANIQATLSTWKDRQEELTKVCQEFFNQTDTNGDRVLEWNNDEIRSFMRLVLAHYDIPLPAWPDQKWYDLYRLVDVDRNRSLDVSECQLLVRRLMEEIAKTTLGVA